MDVQELPGCKDMCQALYGCSYDDVRVLDLETTGLSPYTDEILSVSICDGNGNVLMDELVKPKFTDAWPDAEKVNGISPRNVRRAPSIDELDERIREHINEEHLIVGYNIDFDLQFLVCAPLMLDIGIRRLDVMELYREMTGKRSGTRLADCASHYGYSFSAHSSCEDAVATAFCFRRMNVDPSYYEPLVDSKFPPKRTLAFKRTKATDDAIGEILPGVGRVELDGELRIGKVTRGKNKGADRYECVAQGLTVGVGTMDMIDSVKESLGLSPDCQAPDAVECKVEIQRFDNSTSCSATYDADRSVMNAYNSIARRMPSLEDELASESEKARRRSEQAQQPDTSGKVSGFLKKLFSR